MLRWILVVLGLCGKATADGSSMQSPLLRRLTNPNALLKMPQVCCTPKQQLHLCYVSTKIHRISPILDVGVRVPRVCSWIEKTTGMSLCEKPPPRKVLYAHHQFDVLYHRSFCMWRAFTAPRDQNGGLRIVRARGACCDMRQIGQWQKNTLQRQGVRDRQ